MAVKYYIQYFGVEKVEKSLTKSNISIIGGGDGYNVGDIIYISQPKVIDDAVIQVTQLGFNNSVDDFEVVKGGSGYENDLAFGECPDNPDSGQVLFNIVNVAGAVEHYITIDVPDYEGPSTRVGGKAILNYSETDNVLECIRGNALTIELEADVNLTFSDLWSEDEKTVRVNYFRGELPVPLFAGFLSPEGFYENWVSTHWMITFDCVDGLGYLKNLSYVDDNGFSITGYKTQIETLVIALKRTGFEHKIATGIDIRYIELDSSLDPLANTYVNSARYIKDDGETIMDCEAVIRDILEPYGAVLTYWFGFWTIYKPNQLYLSQSTQFYSYKPTGILEGKIDITDLNLSIYSDFYNPLPNENSLSPVLIHCNDNQRITNVSSLGAYRVSYTYGVVAGFDENNNLITYDGLTVPKWTIVDNTNLELAEIGEGGIYLTTDRNIPNGPSLDVEQFKSDGITLPSGTVADIKVKISTDKVGFTYFAYKMQVKLTTSSTTYYLLGVDNSWTTTPVFVVKSITTKANTIELFMAELPADGVLTIHVWSPENRDENQASSEVKIKTESIIVTIPVNEGQNAPIGEFHTVQRKSKPSSKISIVKEVSTGDNDTDLYLGTTLQSDQVTPTEHWTRKGMNEAKPLLQIMGEENLRMSANTARIFSGSVYGFFPYLSVISIDGLDGLFMPIKYSYDTVENIITGEYKQIFGDELGDDIEYLKTYNNDGNVVTPTII